MKPDPNNKRPSRCLARIVRHLRFYLEPLLAIKPVPHYWNRPIEDTPMKLVFQWQKMPEGYQWLFPPNNPAQEGESIS